MRPDRLFYLDDGSSTTAGKVSIVTGLTKVGALYRLQKSTDPSYVFRVHRYRTEHPIKVEKIKQWISHDDIIIGGIPLHASYMDGYTIGSVYWDRYGNVLSDVEVRELHKYKKELRNQWLKDSKHNIKGIRYE